MPKLCSMRPLLRCKYLFYGVFKPFVHVYFKVMIKEMDNLTKNQ